MMQNVKKMLGGKTFLISATLFVVFVVGSVSVLRAPVAQGQGGGGGTFVCTGSVPQNSALCPGDNIGLSENTPWEVHSFCSLPDGSAPKCERICDPGYEESGGTCESIGPPSAGLETGNVFGWAWSSNVGWIKMNSCSDTSPFDGEPDNPGVCQVESGGNKPFGVKINNDGVMGGPGTMSGHAWSPSVGWIRFGGLSQFPTGGGTYTGDAELTNVTETSGTFKGWARAVTGNETPGWDGWLSLAGTNYPSGPAFINGSRGVTFHPPTAKLVGYAWGGEVLGWVEFSGDDHKVTYGAPGAFDYHLTSSPSAVILLQDDEGNAIVTRVLDSGEPENITLSATVLGAVADKPTVSIDTNQTCEECGSVLTISTSANTPFGSYVVRVTGSPEDDVPSDSGETVDIAVTVAPDAGDLVVTCEVLGQPPFYVNVPVTWSSTVTGGLPPYSYVWTGTDNLNGSGPTATKTYATTGIKTADVFVSDSVGHQSSCSQQGSTPQITVTVQPGISEF